MILYKGKLFEFDYELPLGVFECRSNDWEIFYVHPRTAEVALKVDEGKLTAEKAQSILDEQERKRKPRQ